MFSKLQVTIVALVCSFTSVSATNVQHSQMHAYLPLYSGQAFNPAHFPLMLPAATSPQSPISEGVLRSKGLNLIDLILLKQLTSRISQVEETAKNLTSSNSQLEETVNNLTISNDELEGTVNNLTISNDELEGTVNNLAISNNQLEETVKNLTSSNGQGGSGQPTSIGGMTTSYDDLQKLGNSKSRFYNIKNTTEVGTVFCCNFNKGGAMDTATGTFTAPVNGTYFFAFTGTVNFVSASVSRRTYTVGLIRNGDTVGSVQTDESNVEDFHNESLHLEATLLLNKNDQIWLRAAQSPGIILDGFGYTHFTGMLLAETIFPAASLLIIA